MESQKGSQVKDQTTREQTGGRPDPPNSNDGKRKRTRLSHSEQQGSEEGHFHHDPISQGTGERVWFNRSIYERADVAYQTLLSSGSGSPPVASSPKERIPRTLVFRAKRNAGQPYQEEENYAHTRSFTSRREQQGSNHQRSSSEPQRARHVPNRKRVYSETERAPPRREKYG